MTKVAQTFEDKIKVADMQKDMIAEAMQVTEEAMKKHEI